MNELVNELRKIRTVAGSPSLRDISEATGINRTTLSEILSGRRREVKWETIESIVEALNGNPDDFRSIWKVSRGDRSAKGNAVSTEQEPIACFLSYSHTDDEQIQVSAALKSGLEYFALANRGRKLTVFLDKEDIGLGQDWQQSLRRSVLGATIFMPVVTYSYFQSVWCREELLLFYRNAKVLGVTELIVPLVVFGHGALSTESDDEVARIISERQYVDLQEAFLDGVDSPAWRRAMLRIADSLVDAAVSAEAHLVERAQDDLTAVAKQSDPDDDFSINGSGLMELAEDAMAISGSLPTLATKYVSEMNSAIDVLRNDIINQNSRRAEWSSKRFTLLASRVAPLAQRAADTGSEMESQAAKADSVLREAIDLMDIAGMDEQRQSLIAEFARMGESNNLDLIETPMNDILQSMLTAEVLSVSLRKALRPLRNSIRSIRSATKIIDSWRRLDVLRAE